jgi:hypothetical protein
MKQFLLLVAILAVALSSLRAAPTRVPEHNFSVEIPDGWIDIRPLPPETVLAKKNAANTKGFMVAATKLSGSERDSGAADFRGGVKKGMTERGAKIDPEERLTIAGLPFVSFAAHVPTGQTFLEYSTAAGDLVYLLQIVASPGIDVAHDSELQSIVQSFRLLSAVPSAPLDATPQSAAYKAGYLFGRFAAIGVVVWLIIRLFSRRKAT